MTDLSALIAANAQRWAAMHILAPHVQALELVAARLVASEAKAIYQRISARTGVPWFVIAVIHEREASQSWHCSIAQGDPWNEVSRHVPVGRGAFPDFDSAAYDALTNCAPYAARWKDWTIGGILTVDELYNGLGYYFHGLPSPYNFGGTDQQKPGKFVSDRHFDPNVMDTQLGCAPMLATMAKLDTSIVFDVRPSSTIVAAPSIVPPAKPLPLIVHAAPVHVPARLAPPAAPETRDVA